MKSLKTKKSKNKEKWCKKKKILVSFSILILITVIVVGGYFIYEYFKTHKSSKSIIRDTSFFAIDVAGDVNIIGYISIPDINLNKAPIAEGIDNKTLSEYVGHFPDSAYLEGNVSLAAHNRGYENNFFENLKNVQKGQKVYYQTKNETKIYEVTEIKEISEEDVEVINNTQENKITLITCVENKPKLRLCIVADESKENV